MRDCITTNILQRQIKEACARIPPLWPLKSFVAVNPFVGLSNMPFVDACALLSRVTHGDLVMPLSYYKQQLDSGQIQDTDLFSAIDQAQQTLPPMYAAELDQWTVKSLKAVLQEMDSMPVRGQARDAVFTVADAVDQMCCTSWAAFVVDEISKWCSAYYDEGQASWRMPWRGEPIFAAWKQAALRDANPEMMGLRDFRAFVARLPDEAITVIADALNILQISSADTTEFLHRELMSIAGWSGYTQRKVRDNHMDGKDDDSLHQLLAIRIVYDVALHRKYDAPELRHYWIPTGISEKTPSSRSSSYIPRFLWQLAAENAYQRQLLAHLVTTPPPRTMPTARPEVQAVFCIDVRSELLRRALEAEDPGIATVGFAGFFGFAIEYVPFGRQEGQAQCPVLLKPGFRIRETLRGASPDQEANALQRQSFSRRLEYAWNAFKTSAVSCFSFVETAGLLSGFKLVKDSLGLHYDAPREDAFTPSIHAETTLNVLDGDEQAVHAAVGLSISEQIMVAGNALKNMGLTANFARLVLFCGHGSDTTNNPYGAALDCGACGGYSGEANARVAALALNCTSVRKGLRERGICIPEDTVFLAALHNTTTDDVHVFDAESVPITHHEEVRHLQRWLESASHQVRLQRAPSLGYSGLPKSKIDRNVRARSRDWAQIRPEWGLAGNAAFVAAPRSRTQGLDLGGRAFLHDYDYHTDKEGSILELIMTAPMVVASWINLQYFASTVNNEFFGSGNKTLHNVVGTMGIWQGNSGDLQVGLPLQSLHDGQTWRHEPLRLSVLIEAPHDVLNRVIEANSGIRELLDNGWLHLIAIEEEGQRFARYCGGLQWESIVTSSFLPIKTASLSTPSAKFPSYENA
jgi:uncharacterized protein YbcC (UPF0753/DUF2309 family)